MTPPSDYPSIDALEGEPGWLPLNLPRKFDVGRSFVSGEPEGDRLRVRYFLRESDEAFCARIWCGPGAEGPPRHAHGGAGAALLDELMGFGAWVRGIPVVAAQISIRYRAKLPLFRIVSAESSIRKVDGRKVHVWSRIYNPEDDGVYVEGEGLFIKRSLEDFTPKFKDMIQGHDLHG